MMNSPNKLGLPDPISAVQRLHHPGSSGSSDGSTSGQQNTNFYPTSLTNSNFFQYNSNYIARKPHIPSYSRTKALKILQWNVKGYVNNYDELNVLIKNFSPNIISLQETHCCYQHKPVVPKTYEGYFHNFPTNLTAKQGIGVLVKTTCFIGRLQLTLIYLLLLLKFKLP